MTEEPTMPISDELHDLVGNPVPSGDLGQRARDRAGEIKRRRMAGIVTSVVAVSVLAVPGALLVRDQSGSVSGAAGGGGAEPSPAATSATGVLSTVVTKVVPQPQEPSAADKARFASALALLGKGFTRTGSGLVVETKTGKQVGTSAIFTATDGGGTVGVQWTDGAALATWLVAPALTAVGPAPSGVLASGAMPAVASAVVAAPSGTGIADGGLTVVGGGFASGQAVASAGPGAAGFGSVTGSTGTDASTNVVSGTVSQNGKMQVSVKVVQGKAGSPRILPGNAAIAFANDLLKAG
jgi:hypothetical protein